MYNKKRNRSLIIKLSLLPLSGYLSVLVNSQWRNCWCLIKNGQLWFYQEKNKNKVCQPAVTLGGCSVLPDPSPEHLYSFRIDMDGTQLATLEVDDLMLSFCFAKSIQYLQFRFIRKQDRFFYNSCSQFMSAAL